MFTHFPMLDWLDWADANLSEEMYNMADVKGLTQDEMSDLVACIDAEITSCERRADQKNSSSQLPEIRAAWLRRGEVLKTLRQKLVMKP